MYYLNSVADVLDDVVEANKNKDFVFYAARAIWPTAFVSEERLANLNTFLKRTGRKYKIVPFDSSKVIVQKTIQ